MGEMIRIFLIAFRAFMKKIAFLVLRIIKQNWFVNVELYTLHSLCNSTRNSGVLFIVEFIIKISKENSLESISDLCCPAFLHRNSCQKLLRIPYRVHVKESFNNIIIIRSLSLKKSTVRNKRIKREVNPKYSSIWFPINRYEI